MVKNTDLDLFLIPIPARKRVGWKKICCPNNGRIIAKLEIREYVRTHFQEGDVFFLRKCRTEKAKVLGYYKIKRNGSLTPMTPIEKPGKMWSGYDITFFYPKVGEWVKAKGFDPTAKVCSSGIHFFLDKKDAISW